MSRPDVVDLPARDVSAGTIRCKILRHAGRPYAVELEHRYPEDGEDGQGDYLFLHLHTLAEIGEHVRRAFRALDGAA